MIRTPLESTIQAAELFADHLSWAKELARYIARRRGMRPDDVEADALVGLWQASERFQPIRNANFRSFAETRIRCQIIDGWRRTQKCPRAKYDRPKFRSLSQKQFRHVHTEHVEECYEDVLTADDHPPEYDLGQADAVGHLLRGSTAQERFVMIAYHLEGWTMQQIGDRMGVSLSRVQGLLIDATQWLRGVRSQEYGYEEVSA